MRLEDEAQTCVSVYFETRYSLHQLCVLPGLRIRAYNLVKKSSGENEFRSNTNLSVVFEQDLDVLAFEERFAFDHGNAQAREAEESRETRKKTIYDNLNELDTIFESFYLQNKGSWKNYIS